MSDSEAITRLAAGERGSHCLARTSNSLASRSRTEERRSPNVLPIDATLEWGRLQPMIRISITAAAYAAIRESLPPAKSRRYAPQKVVSGLYV